MLEHECIKYASESHLEQCGLIIDNSYLFKCKNSHSEPEKHFRISGVDWSEAEKLGEVTAVFHSHPQVNLRLSAADRKQQLMTGLDWWLVSDNRLRVFEPVPHLLGRHFEHGITDCCTLFRDAYHLCGVDLPEFERSDGWWLRDENLYIKNLPENGFYQVELSDIQPLDIIIRSPFYGANPSHAMVYLGDNIAIHHDCAGNLSRREALRQGHWRTTHSIWRHEKWLNLNSEGIFEDILATSI
ncbi:C40 family peptidase [Providencia rettgeri]|uniref:C40 family peptidase n=1 Tax=Providencia rettgeri TaxID=587 RepID=UPI003010074F